jgi:hypothetical protein
LFSFFLSLSFPFSFQFSFPQFQALSLTHSLPPESWVEIPLSNRSTV